MRILVILLISIAPSVVHALPQFAVRSSRMCSNCHVSPAGWNNPELSKRKCSLNCNTCHVNPTGGGMRNIAGRFYGREILPAFGVRPSEAPVAKPAPPATPSSRSATMLPDATPADLADARYPIPGPGTAARYGGLTPYPVFQVGTDVRLMLYSPSAPDAKLAVFPMQTDLYLAFRPYNPQVPNEGRITMLATGGVLGSRSSQFDGFQDRIFLKEWWALYDELPYQFYAKVGRFLPAYGWRLDDHSAFIRQEQGPFRHDQQVTGLEVGLNPNYLYAHASIYNAARQWDKPIDFDRGLGTALTAGYRELFWQAGGSLMLERNTTQSDLYAGANWSLNFFEATHAWKGFNWFPVTYLGEFDYHRRSPSAAGARDVDGLTSFHELDWLVTTGLNMKARYDWIDPDLSLKDDHRHRYTVGLELHPYTFVELMLQYRHNVETPGTDSDELIVQLHGWY